MTIYEPQNTQNEQLRRPNYFYIELIHRARHTPPYPVAIGDRAS